MKKMVVKSTRELTALQNTWVIFIFKGLTANACTIQKANIQQPQE